MFRTKVIYRENQNSSKTFSRKSCSW